MCIYKHTKKMWKTAKPIILQEKRRFSTSMLAYPSMQSEMQSAKGWERKGESPHQKDGFAASQICHAE